ncbi:gluconolactonase [Bacillus sp. SA1-12]|uniref:SMP-30/gluconolactonase/LRE family protein n=1 Tax=Bacillus sp. SA1-12 TaxID=1455638 RepID=UPI0006269F07|nr:SMP-30/gluconolactonase/LRE family protein [Bacillus sp. SA1-12]KKI92782.1 gluconolactonase [Bacillus sp. SA1-12]
MEAKVERKYSGQLLEGPLWDEERDRLLCVDILNNKLINYDPTSQALHDIEFSSNITSVVKAKDSKLLLSTRNQLILFDETNKASKELISLDDLGKNMRFNDGKCDPYNRFWVGTMSEDGARGKANLYVVDANGEMKKAKEGLSISNGLAWNQAGDTIFVIDTPTNKIMSYPFSKETTELKEGSVVIDLKDIKGSPDGMTIDINDRLWIALWGGYRVICVDPRLGKIVASITLPVSNVTSCTFGGSDMRTLYITTAREGVGNDKLKLEPLAGSLFSCQLEVQGLVSIPYVY